MQSQYTNLHVANYAASPAAAARTPVAGRRASWWERGGPPATRADGLPFSAGTTWPSPQASLSR
jgi:hypothetical protein